MKKKRTIPISIVMLVTIPFIMLTGTSGTTIIEDYTGSPQPDPSSTWVVSNFNDFIKTDSYAFNKQDPIDYDDSVGSVPYGTTPPPFTLYDGNVNLLNWYDPNDPAIVSIPTPPPYPLGAFPTYLPYPDDPILLPAADAYSAGYPTTSWNIVNDTERMHYPEWNALPYTQSSGSVGLVLPYSVTEIMKSIPEINYTLPNWNYFGMDYDAVKFSMKVDSNYISDAISVHVNALGGIDPYTNTFSPVVPSPFDYLELGQVALINSSQLALPSA